MSWRAIICLLLSLQLAAARQLRQYGEEPGTSPPPPPPVNESQWDLPIGAWDLPTDLMSQSTIQAQGGAIAALGVDNLRIIRHRAKVQVEVEELAKAIDADADLYVDRASLRLQYRCPAQLKEPSEAVPSPSPPPSEPVPSPAPSSPSPPLDDGMGTAWDPQAAVIASLTEQYVFALHSRPSAKDKIFLAFRGCVTTQTWWNDNNKPTIITPAWDTDGDVLSFSKAELEDIYSVWRIVAEDYSMFDVDVTLEAPSDTVLDKRGVRVCIGGSSSDWLGGSAGGIAWVGSYNSTNPCFVFPKQLGPFEPKYVGEAASHEAGHTLGLLHDGSSSTSYYPGQGDWAPIMGNSYFKPISQWSKGEYAGANNKQDDLDVMQQFLDRLPPPKYNSMSSAARLSMTANGGSASGIIARQGQVDWWEFEGRAGKFLVSAIGAGYVTEVMYGNSGKTNIGDLNMRLTLLDGSGRQIASANPPGASAEALGGSILTTLPSDGTYYITVTGEGDGDPVSTGYSAYATLGSYNLNAVFDPKTGGTGGSLDCEGSFGAWSECSKQCGGGTMTHVYSVTSPKKGDGKDCPYVNGYTETTKCNTQSCGSSPPPPPASPSPPPPAGKTLKITRIDMSRVSAGVGKSKCKAIVTVTTSSGAPVPKARLTASWQTDKAVLAKGFNQGTVTAKSATKGTAVFTSRELPSSGGNSCYFSVSKITLAGYTWTKSPYGSTSLHW